MLNFVKQSFAIVSLAAVLSTFSAGFAPAVSEAAPPPPRGGIRVMQPVPRPVIHQPRPVLNRPPVHRPGPDRVYHRPAPRPYWRPAPPPPGRYYDYREARRDRRIARIAAVAAIAAAVLGR